MVTADLGRAGSFWLKMARDGGWLVAGQSLVGDAHTERLLLYGEVIAGLFLLLAASTASDPATEMMEAAMTRAADGCR